jgi:hypothetical protein
MVGSSSFSSLQLQDLCEELFFIAHKVLNNRIFNFLKIHLLSFCLNIFFYRQISQPGDFISRKGKETHTKIVAYKFFISPFF